MRMLLLVPLVLLVASPAYAGRWKAGGVIPAGVERRTATDGTVCWKSTETGTNQCRWKLNNGCKWTHESGSDQCSPSTPPPAVTDPWKPVTFVGTKGTVKMTPFRTGVANRWGVQFDAFLTFTGERVKGEVTWYNPVGSRDVRPVSHRITGLDMTTKLVLRGPTGTRTPIDPSASTPGVPPPSWVPQPPGSLPPTGESCYYAWYTFQTQQMQCLSQYMSGFWSNAWRGAITDATVNAFTCIPVAVAGLAAGPEMSATVYGLCIAANTGKPLADYLLDGLFWGKGLSSQPMPPACTADEYARARLSQACQTAMP